MISYKNKNNIFVRQRTDFNLNFRHTAKKKSNLLLLYYLSSPNMRRRYIYVVLCVSTFHDYFHNFHFIIFLFADARILFFFRVVV